VHGKRRAYELQLAHYDYDFFIQKYAQKYVENLKSNICHDKNNKDFWRADSVIDKKISGSMIKFP
jgi:hypothetical protein